MTPTKPARGVRARLIDWRPHPALVTLLVLVAMWSVVFGRLIFQRHDRFYSFGFDLGIHDQAVWLMSRGDPTATLTVRGIPALGHHATFAYWLLAPAYWLGAGPHFLNLIQVLSLAAGALVLFALTRRLSGSPWLGLVVGVAWLAHPSTQFLVWETFHPDAMGITWLFGAYLAARAGRWRWFWVCAVIAMCWKEDYSLAIVVLGGLMVLWGERRRAAMAVAAGSAWFVLTVMVLMPAITGHGVHAGTFYGELGESPSEVAVNALRNPDVAWDRLGDNDALGYLRRVSEPFGHTAVLAPAATAIGLPMLAINLLSIAYFIVDVRYHYVSLPLAAFALASVEGLAAIARRRDTFRSAQLVALAAIGALAVSALAGGSWWVFAGATVTAGVAVAAAAGRLSMRHLQAGVAVVMLCSAVASYRIHGIGPGGGGYDTGYWPGANRQEAKEAAMELVPDGAPVAATYGFVSHLTHRRLAYEFPNPWAQRNWGVQGEEAPDDTEVDWIVADLLHLSPNELALYDTLVASGEMEEIYRANEIVVARRVEAPSGA